ncbi:hypothetical protein QN277_016827 [Acacia crassicarpa]|uniref:Major facilitator superfamily (MFS) profile domain-containing protein n=1 Tax=Acacia crassicarpa TaxID=499986 RepID=A0AAE1MXK6_9FABA|nr:hypothetical protein QN277_016827 [Acacia crassicarpa]
MAQDDLLNDLDVAKTQWYHFTAIIIAGMGLFTDAYDLFSIANVTKLLGRIYFTEEGSKNPGSLPPKVSMAINGVTLCGTVAGQIFFGWLSDKLGRKKVYGMTLGLMVIASLGSGLSFADNPKGVISVLCFFRFWLGFGIGGDYPISATLMAEYANKKTRGAFLAAVFAMQGFGILVGGVVSIIVSTAFDHAYKAPPYNVDAKASLPPQADYVWRIILMFGAVPAAITLYWRMKMPETARFTVLVNNDIKQATIDMSKVLQVKLEANEQPESSERVLQDELKADKQPKSTGRVLQVELKADEQPKSSEIELQVGLKADEQPKSTERMLQVELKADEKPKSSRRSSSSNFGLFSSEFARRHGIHFLGTCATWFLLDITYYYSNLFQKDIYTAVGWLPQPAEMNAIHEVYRVARAQVLIALCGTVPGYWFTVALIDILGRFFIQLMGFFFMTVFMFALAIPYDHWKNDNKAGFLAIYAFTFFFANFGPNTTTFIISVEIFPTRLRSTCHGLSAAAGKTGAIVGTFGFLYASQDTDPKKTDTGYPTGIGMKNTLIMLGVINFVGMLFTFLVPETMGKSLEEISRENEEEEGGGGDQPAATSRTTNPV